MSVFRGQFYDGKSAARHEVTVEVKSYGIEIIGDENKLLATWPYDELEAAEEFYGGQPMRIKCRSQPDARLRLPDAAILGTIGDRAPGLSEMSMVGARTLPRALIWGGAVIAILVVIYFTLPKLAEPVAALVPVEWETTWGETIVKQVAPVFGAKKFCDNRAGRAALDRLVRRLRATVSTPYKIRVRVLDTPMVNAFAVPGGQVILLRGLIAKAKTAEEVAGVLAHEMGHVIERHPLEALVRAVGLSFLLTALTGDSAGVGAGLAEFGATLAALSFSRHDEEEADTTGVAMLNSADIRADGLVGFFERLAKEHGDVDKVLAYVGTHPSSRERAATIRANARGKGPAMSTADWKALQSICR